MAVRSFEFCKQIVRRSTCPTTSPLVLTLDDDNVLGLYAYLVRERPLRWTRPLAGPVIFCVWSPDGRQIAVGFQEKILVICTEDGQAVRELAAENVTFGKWVSVGAAISVLVVGSAKLLFYLNGQHPVVLDKHTEPIVDLAISKGLTSFSVYDGASVQRFKTSWDEAKLDTFLEAMRQITQKCHEKLQWDLFDAAIIKFTNGVNWVKDKLCHADAAGLDLLTAVKALILHEDLENEYRSALKASTSMSTAYRFRDQLIKCFEDMRKASNCLGTDTDSKLLIVASLESIEENVKVLLSWFLSC